MNKSTFSKSKYLITLIAGLVLTVGMPIGAEAGGGGYDNISYNSAGQDGVKQIKVKDHKVKVKLVGGKAKIKTKANGKEKIKIKGRNGQLAAQMAANAQAPCQTPAPHYGK